MMITQEAHKRKSSHARFVTLEQLPRAVWRVSNSSARVPVSPQLGGGLPGVSSVNAFGLTSIFRGVTPRMSPSIISLSGDSPLPCASSILPNKRRTRESAAK